VKARQLLTEAGHPNGFAFPSFTSQREDYSSQVLIIQEQLRLDVLRVDAESDIRVELTGNASYIGWDVVCLGRTESSERYARGRWGQRCDVFRNGALIWSERMVLDGNSPWLSSPAAILRPISILNPPLSGAN
jgi:hypothetical protein